MNLSCTIWPAFSAPTSRAASSAALKPVCRPSTFTVTRRSGRKRQFSGGALSRTDVLDRRSLAMILTEKDLQLLATLPFQQQQLERKDADLKIGVCSVGTVVVFGAQDYVPTSVCGVMMSLRAARKQ